MKCRTVQPSTWCSSFAISEVTLTFISQISGPAYINEKSHSTIQGSPKSHVQDGK